MQMFRISRALAAWALLLLCLSASTLTLCAQAPAAKPLFRDPVHDGAADPTIIWNPARREWWMFYTNRRADLAPVTGKDVSWVHGTRIGIAVSRDGGNSWTYRGVARIPYGKDDYTQWAPDIVFSGGQYHMFLTIVPGTFKDWGAPREIVHLTSPDLERWTYVSKLDIGSAKIIDASLFPLTNIMPKGGWRVWYKDEADGSTIHFADSPDLTHWTPGGRATQTHMEGPKVFRWKGVYWMITDVWDGLGVFRSDDLTHWTQQPDNILKTPGSLATDRSAGHHCDVVVSGDHAYIFYFTHQMGPDADPKVENSKSHTVLQVAELQERDGVITVNRDKPVHVALTPP